MIRKDFLSEHPGAFSVTRFAPSPTGFLHRGHILSAIYVWGVARSLGAKIILRIEDHDRTRSRTEYEEAILRDLEWLGFEADLGVEAVGVKSEFRQSNHLERYERQLNLWRERQLAYACDCSRKNILDHMNEPGSEELRYSGRCRGRKVDDHNAGRPVGWRLMTEASDEHFVDGICGAQKQNPAAQCGDLLLKDRHECFTYQMCVAIDDVADKVDLVIRGQDLLSSTGRQLYLRRLIDHTASKPVFIHHPLITDESGRKLSKRFYAEAIAKDREDGRPAATVLAEVATLGGLTSSHIKALEVADLAHLILAVSRPFV